MLAKPFEIGMIPNSVFVALSIASQQNRDSWVRTIKSRSQHVDLKTLVDPLFSAAARPALEELDLDACSAEMIPNGSKIRRYRPNADAARLCSTSNSQAVQVFEVDPNAAIGESPLTPGGHVLRRDENVGVIPEQMHYVRHASPPDRSQQR
jgi:hypothetical protein